MAVKVGAGVVVAAFMAVLVPSFSGAQINVPTPGVPVPGAPVTGPTELPDPNAPATPRNSAPIVLTGSQLGDWSVPANQTVKVPLTDLIDCHTTSTDSCSHNHYEPPEVDTGDKLGQGAATDRFLGYRWDGKRFRQIPFEVDQVFTRYLENSASGFAFYSGDDQHTTYAYDREGWRYTDSDPNNVCKAIPFEVTAADGTKSRPKTTPDPVPGLDDNDELAFMASDAGQQAPSGTPAPAHVDGVKEVRLTDPNDPTAAPTFVYIMRAAEHGGPKPAFDAKNGYVSYKRDKIAETFEKSESSYANYGNAARGEYCDAQGNVVLDPATGKPDIQRRRPRDYASIGTPRYHFRYDGRWLLTALNISPNGGKTFGPDLIDRWKARAFQQDPSSGTPCCGFEEEDQHWGGSSTLLGERVGPVRAVRETWGADSGTNVIRRETFYRDSMVQKSYLRVHPIPPLDGIYAQWDFNAGRMTRFANRQHPDGVPVDGRNDEALGNFDDPCNDNYDNNDTSQLDQGYRSFYGTAMLCRLSDIDHQSLDFFDPTFSEANAALDWGVTSGPYGTIVDHITTQPADMTAGGVAQSVVAVPYYRDDSCFDDGTGTDPGPRVRPGEADEPRTTAAGADRKCWHPEDGLPDGSDKFFQGDIATHGVHLLFTGDTDNARQTVPIDQIVSETNMVMLPPAAGTAAARATAARSKADADGFDPAIGPAFGDAFDRPLVAKAGRATTVRDASAPVVRLRVNLGRQGRRSRFSIRWAGTDTGGSGLRSFTLQVKRPHGRFRTVKAHTRSRSYAFSSRRPGRYAFRVSAVDGAGNVSRWSLRRAVLRRSR
jgi:hypothetical protein